jgi:phage terminase large subunit-like protein
MMTAALKRCAQVEQLNTGLLQRWHADPIEFIETVLFDPATKRPFQLLPAERIFLEHAFKRGPNGKLLYDEWLYSCPKKSGKTTFEALIELTMTLLYGGAFPESYILANSQEQGKGRVFESCCRIVNASPLLKDEVVITADRISFPTFNAVIYVVPCDAGSAAGTNSVCSGFDELWAYTSEAARRLWDEMAPPPTRKIACRCTVTYAGFEGESLLLEELYRRGLQQPLVGEDLYAGDGLLMFWSHKPIAPWQDEAWLTSMRRQRASAYQRQVLNQFASSSSQFIEMDWWRRCVDPNYSPVLTDKTSPILVGVDASTKHDSTALVAVTWDRRLNKVRQVTHKIFQPSPQRPLDFEASIEATLIDWARKFRLLKVLYDPYQMAPVAQRLTKVGVPMREFPQTPGNLTLIGTALYDLIRGASLVTYPDNDFGIAISRAIIKEGARGLQITKEKASHKIDAVIALAMAAHAALKHANIDKVPICGPVMFSVATGQTVIGPNTDKPAAPGLHRPMMAEPWYPHLSGNAGNAPPGGWTHGPAPGSPGSRREW